MIFAVVCVRPDGHRTVLNRMASADRAECERFAAKRDAHPNAIALNLRHEVAQVTTCRKGVFVEVSP